MEFKNAGLIHKYGGILDHFETSLDDVMTSPTGDKLIATTRYFETKGFDNECIIGVNQVSNMLHVLAGLPPVPSKRKTILSVNEKLMDIAKKSYIRYTTPIRYTDKGYIKGGQVIQTDKVCKNSNRKFSTVIALNGQDTKVTGNYTWNYIQRYYGKDNFNILYDFLCDFFNDNNLMSHKSFIQVISDLSYHYDHPKLLKFKSESGNFIKTKWMQGLLFGGYNISNGCNTVFCGRTPLLNMNGITQQVDFDGEIVFPIDDNEVIKAISEHGGTSRLLEGGFAYIKSVSQFFNTEGFDKVYQE